MAHGTPDWAGTAPTQTVSSVQDLGELAARLGSVDKYERHGNVVFMDDFRYGITAYVFGSTGAGEFMQLSNALSHTSGWSMVIYVGSVGAQYAAPLQTLAILNPGRVGFETAVFFTGTMLQFRWAIDHDDSVNETFYGVRYNVADNKFYYITTGDAYVPFTPALKLNQAYNLFHNSKLVVDLAAKKYVRFEFDNHVWDMSAFNGDPGVSGGIEQVAPQLKLYGDSAHTATAYIDTWIVTQNEP